LFESIFLAQTVGATVKVRWLITCEQNQFYAGSQRCVTADEMSPERISVLFPSRKNLAMQ
jgi:hypothetical protein